jgi:5-methylcytosine-specific restriction protein A
MKMDFQRIRNVLEDAYDIPFHVDGGMTYSDPWYVIYPENNGKELFELRFTFKQHMRLTIEMQPQKYGAFSVQDMSKASEEKKIIFAEYAKLLLEKRAKIELLINQIPANPLEPASWPLEWYNIRCRITRSPIVAENEEFNSADIVCKWVKVVSGMFLSLLNVIQVDEENENNHLEGRINRIIVNRYERNPINRELCLASNGYTCKICGFNFNSMYGNIGYNYIHVHHVIPVSQMGGEYVINPVIEMIPVCPNCHAMLHKIDPPYLPDELKYIINVQKQKNEKTI